MTNLQSKLGSLLEPQTRTLSEPPQPRGGGAQQSGQLRKVAVISISAIVILIGAFVTLRYAGVGETSPAEASRRRTLIDAETGEVFRDYRIADGTQSPWMNPKTRARTLYPAEACYWNADGTAKLEPTWVFVKAYIDEDEETRCPDCGRRVVLHNPLPPTELLVQAGEAAKGGR